MPYWFDETFYLHTKASYLNITAAQGRSGWTIYSLQQELAGLGLTPFEDYLQRGAYEKGVNPARHFDDEQYYADKAQYLNDMDFNGRDDWTSEEVLNVFRLMQLSPAEDYLRFGRQTGITAETPSYVKDDGWENSAGDEFLDPLLYEDYPTWNAEKDAGEPLNYAFTGAAAWYPGLRGVEAMDDVQQGNVEIALAKIGQITGLTFQETDTSVQADITFANADLGFGVLGVTYSGYQWQNRQVDLYADIYIDNDQNSDYAPGTYEFETILHELGHAMGLKHPFEGSHTLPLQYDTTEWTLMSYTWSEIHQDYQEFDVIALQYLYGTDGIDGYMGLGSSFA